MRHRRRYPEPQLLRESLSGYPTYSQGGDRERFWQFADRLSRGVHPTVKVQFSSPRLWRHQIAGRAREGTFGDKVDTRLMLG